MQLLTGMAQLMRTGNRVELSTKDGMLITGMSTNVVTAAIKELRNKGCIQVLFARNKTRATVYMVNPEIFTVGKADNSKLCIAYWILTGDRWEDGKYVRSSLHNKWCLLKQKQLYTRGHDVQVDKAGKEVFFNKVNEVLEKEEPADSVGSTVTGMD